MRVVLAFAACVLIWGSTWYAIEWQLGYVAKEWSLTYRFALASLLLFLWCYYKKLPLSFSKSAHLYMLGTGFFLFSANYNMMYLGTIHLTSGLVAVAFSLLSFLNIVNGKLFLKADVQLSTFAAAMLGVFGLVLIFKPEIQNFGLGDMTTYGLAACVLGTLLASFGNTIVGTKKVKSLPLLPFNAWGMAYGTAFNLLAALIAAGAPTLDPRPEYYGALFYLSVMGTVVAFSLYLWLIDQIGVAKAAYMSVMMPLVALFISTFLEGFTWTIYAASGLALVVLGNILMIKSKTPAKTE